MAATPLEIELAWRIRTDWQAGPLLRHAASHAAAAEGFRTGQLSLAVVGCRAMSALHERYTRQRGPTDVLTFDLGTNRRARCLLGEIVVCADVAQRRARPRTRAAARAELALYVVHGVLHLAGYDDHDADAFRRMHAREDELLSALGLGPVFARARGFDRHTPLP